MKVNLGKKTNKKPVFLFQRQFSIQPGELSVKAIFTFHGFAINTSIYMQICLCFSTCKTTTDSLPILFLLLDFEQIPSLPPTKFIKVMEGKWEKKKRHNILNHKIPKINYLFHTLLLLFVKAVYYLSWKSPHLP